MRKIFLASCCALSISGCADVSSMLTPDNIRLMSNGMTGIARDVAQGTAKMSETAIDALAEAAIVYCSPITQGGRDTMRSLVNQALDKKQQLGENANKVRLGEFCVTAP